MKKQLRKPEYWTDFEDLCKRLWSEIWNYPETKKHGRNGQEQQGIDVYGKEGPEKGFIGIQCKGKDEYTHKQLTSKEIDAEIEKAKNFKPPLQKMYFATTSNRSTEIDKYVREKDLENTSKGLFSIHVFFWEDIAELIDENKKTHDWYLRGINFHEKHNAVLKFKSDDQQLLVEPVFDKYIIKYVDVSILDYPEVEGLERDMNEFRRSFLLPKLSIKTKDDLINFMNDFGKIDTSEVFLNPQPKIFETDMFFREVRLVNNSVGCAEVILHNTGSASITDLKLKLHFNRFLSVDAVDKFTSYLDKLSGSYNYNIYFPEWNVGIVEHKVLVPGDSLSIDELCFIAIPEDQQCEIKWTLYSREFQADGVLIININPKFNIIDKDNFTQKPSQLKSEMIKVNIIQN